jgi:hypothetical protein
MPGFFLDGLSFPSWMDQRGAHHLVPQPVRVFWSPRGGLAGAPEC